MGTSSDQPSLAAKPKAFPAGLRERRVLIVTAVDVERDAVLSALGMSLLEDRDLRIRDPLLIRKVIDSPSGLLDVAILHLPDQGGISVATFVTKANLAFKPNLALLVGIAGSATPPNKEPFYGDVTLATYVVGNRDKFKPAGNDPEPTAIPILPRLKQHIDNVPPWIPIGLPPRPARKNRQPKVIAGVILASSGVIAHAAERDRLAKFSRKSAAIEMEGYGMGYACIAGAETVPWAVIKAICDQSDEKKDDRWHDYAAKAAAQFAAHFLRHQLFLKPLRPKKDSKEVAVPTEDVDESGLKALADKLHGSRQKSELLIQEDLATFQKLFQDRITIEELDEQIEYSRRNRIYSESYRRVVDITVELLQQIPRDLITALEHRGLLMPSGYVYGTGFMEHGHATLFCEHEVYTADDYTMEKTSQLLFGLKQLMLIKSAKAVPIPEKGSVGDLTGQCLIVVRGEAVEIRSATNPAKVLAQLPRQGAPFKSASGVRLQGKTLVAAHTGEAIYLWSPTSAPFPHKEIAIEDHIRCCVHCNAGDKVVTWVLSDAGRVLRTENFGEFAEFASFAGDPIANDLISLPHDSQRSCLITDSFHATSLVHEITEKGSRVIASSRTLLDSAGEKGLKVVPSLEVDDAFARVMGNGIAVRSLHGLEFQGKPLLVINARTVHPLFQNDTHYFVLDPTNDYALVGYEKAAQAAALWATYFLGEDGAPVLLAGTTSQYRKPGLLALRYLRANPVAHLVTRSTVEVGSLDVATMATCDGRTAFAGTLAGELFVVDLLERTANLVDVNEENFPLAMEVASWPGSRNSEWNARSDR
jgi:nucleoside phosphorylase